MSFDELIASNSILKRLVVKYQKCQVNLNKNNKSNFFLPFYICIDKMANERREISQVFCDIFQGLYSKTPNISTKKYFLIKVEAYPGRFFLLSHSMSKVHRRRGLWVYNTFNADKVMSCFPPKLIPVVGLGHFGFVRGTGSELCRIAVWNYIWDVIASLVAILVKIEQRERVITISRE